MNTSAVDSVNSQALSAASGASSSTTPSGVLKSHHCHHRIDASQQNSADLSDQTQTSPFESVLSSLLDVAAKGSPAVALATTATSMAIDLL